MRSRVRLNPERAHRGFTVFLTGLSGAGKSTIAAGLVPVLAMRTGRDVTLLDGDDIRQELSSDLGYSGVDRDTNVRRVARVARVASEITARGGIAVCAVIAPYAAARREARASVERVGSFIELHVATPLAVCEARDTKGLYALARPGGIEAFTGLDDPYEVPESPEIRIDTTGSSVDRSLAAVVRQLERLGVLG